MQLGMGDFVYQGLYRLRLTHTGPQDDSALGWAEISLCSTWNEILHYRNRRTGRETIIHSLKILHIACKLSYSQCWQFPPLGLAHIEYMGYLKACDSGNAGFHFRRSVWIIERPSGLWIFGFLPNILPHRAWGQNLNAFFAPFDLTAKCFFPGVKTSDPAGGWALQKDQQGIAKAVMVKFGHGGQICPVPSAGIQFLDSIFQLFC